MSHKLGYAIIDLIGDVAGQTFVDYVNKAIEFAGTQRFFTISKLIKDGLKHNVDCVGLGDWFDAGLLKNSKKQKVLWNMKEFQ